MINENYKGGGLNPAGVEAAAPSAVQAGGSSAAAGSQQLWICALLSFPLQM